MDFSVAVAINAPNSSARKAMEPPNLALASAIAAKEDTAPNASHCSAARSARSLVAVIVAVGSLDMTNFRAVLLVEQTHAASAWSAVKTAAR